MNDVNDAISRQQAIETFKDCTVNGVGIDGIVDALEQLPPIQPEVVRCKDCKHGVLDDGFPHQYFCVFKGDEWNNADYFCGHAKRREVTT